MSDNTRVADPIFILCHARSGSTLLRYCLDTHPEIACPPETNLASTLSAIYETVLTLPQPSKEEGIARANTTCSDFADLVLGDYARSKGKARWCDKSLSSASFAPLLEKVFPDAKFICLFRGFLDFTLSAIEASPWGFSSYGLAHNAQSNPDNFVSACAQHWIERTSALLDFSDKHPETSMNIRYEDLVSDPAEALGTIFSFLGCAFDPETFDLGSVFSTPHEFGLGDYKIGDTANFTTRSIGRGWRIPQGLIPPWLASAINELLLRLGYPELADVFDVNSTNVSAYSRESIAGASLIERLTTRMNASSNGAWVFGIGKFIIVDGGSGVYLDVANRDARFIRSDEDRGRHFDFVVLTDSNTLARIMSGQTGMSEAVRDGCFSIHPADSIPVSDYQQLFLELTSIVTGGDKVRKYEPMSAMMIANTPEKTDRLHS